MMDPSSDPGLVPIRRALVSVSDKAGLAGLGAALAARGVEVLSTGGTARALREAGVATVEVSDRTGFPEMLDGRVKTLHPVLHGGLLGLRGDPGHVAAMAAHGIAPIDLLAVNLYPFEETAASGADFAACVEDIDIGGPALIRAAAKNHESVAVVVDPADYGALLAEMEAHGGATTLALRRRLAADAFARVAAYDAAIAARLAREAGVEAPRHFALAGRAPQILRYGENPHQSAAFYRTAEARPGAGTARQLHGRELGYNNIADADAAIELVAEFDRPAIVIVKHGNPCGAAEAETLAGAYARAFDCDRTSAFGGVVAANREIDAAAAERIAAIFTEVVAAPSFSAEALDILRARPNLRLLATGAMPDPAGGGIVARTAAGGLLVQSRDGGRIGKGDWRVVTERAPTEGEARDLLVAWRIAKHTKSNAIVYARDGASVGIGAGQPSRVDAARIAAAKAREAADALGLAEPRTVGSAVASDAFFPFADGLLAAAEAGATAVIQPGGSVRDREVVAAANARGLAMVFAGTRHFRH